MKKRLIFIVALLCALLQGAWAQSTTPTVNLENGQNLVESFGENIEQVTVYVNSNEDFWARIVLYFPEGCYLRTTCGTISNSFVYIIHNELYDEHSSHFDPYWICDNHVTVEISGVPASGNAVEASITFSVTNLFKITTEAQLNEYLAIPVDPTDLEKQLRLIDDIVLTNYVGIENGMNVELDLNGHSLSRNLSASSTDGSVISIKSGGTFTLKDSSGNNSGLLTGGRATNGGGVLNKGTFHFNGGTITGCNATNGGAVRNDGTMTMNGGVITSCNADDCGGIYNASGQSLTITSGSITNCMSNAGGGGVVNYGTADISGCTLSDNTATTRGGAIWSKGTLTVDGCTITNNEALATGGDDHNEGDGGAIHVEGGTTTLTDVTITNNTSKDAGGIYVKSGATLNINGTSTISGNTSSEHGGGGIVNYGTVALSGSVSITGNTCHTYGAGLWSNGTLTMQGNIQVKDNTRDDIYLKSGKVININGPLTCGANSLGIRMEFSNVFTNGYSTSGTETDPFYASGSGNIIDFYDGEAKMVYAYYESGWDSENHFTILTLKTIPTEKTVKNICSSEFTTAGGDLNGNYWFVADGTGVIENHSLTCGSGDIHLILCDGADFTTDGLYVNKGSTLHIYSQSYGDFMGKLTSINSSTSKPGIGGEDDETGTIIIHGGHISASGGQYAAGIGGREDRSSGTIIIYAGEVNAVGGIDAAGIGGGEGGSGDVITIYGGTINATSQETGNGAGIGGGEYHLGGSEGGIITIWGGNIIALGAKEHAGGAGIGSGYGDGDELAGDSDHDTFVITIHGGNIIAKGGGWNNPGYKKGGAAGIGGGIFSKRGTVTINGGTIYAVGTLWDTYQAPNNTGFMAFASAIGYGGEGTNSTVIINGGTITAENSAVVSDFYEQDVHAFGSNLSLAPDLTVTAGHDASSATRAAAADRINQCRSRYVKLEPCDHLGAEANDLGESLGITCIYCEMTTAPYTFQSDGDWNVSNNWLGGIIPEGDGKNIVMRAMATIPHDCIAHVGNIDIQTGSSITIEDGGQLKHSNSVPGTIQKNIVGYGDTDNEGGWYLLGAPIAIDSALAVNSGMLDLTNDAIDFTTHGIDLYDFDQNEDNEWVNMRTGDRIHFMGFTADQAYLYARANNATLNFSTYENRLFAPTTEEQLITVTRNTNGAEFAGWNLIPNPFTCNAYLASGRDFWRMNATGDAIVLATDENGGNVIKPCEGIFVVVAAENDPDPFILWGETVPDCAQIRFTTTEPASLGNKGLLDITVKHNDRVADVARVRFGEGDRTNKLVFDETATRLSIMQDGKDYSVVHNKAQGEMPVSFKAKANGTYTISVNPEDVEVNYLHLIDNMTGNEVDMLATPSYTFKAKTADYASRFKLVFSTNGEDGPSTGSGTFAYMSDGNIIIMDADANATLQIMDVTGRVIVSTDVARNVSTAGMTPGVYVLRLINDNDVKTQKIIIE